MLSRLKRSNPRPSSGFQTNVGNNQDGVESASLPHQTNKHTAAKGPAEPTATEKSLPIGGHKAQRSAKADRIGGPERRTAENWVVGLLVTTLLFTCVHLLLSFLRGCILVYYLY